MEKYGIFELRLKCESEPNVTFTCGDTAINVKGFRVGDGEYAVRFMPQTEGVWKYGGAADGEFTCAANTGGNHGPVIANGTHFRYADGTQYVPMGTTCYAWIHQTPELIAKTLETLASAPFNKIRMCVFPKHMPFNQNDPELYPFDKKTDGSWDVNRPNERFWVHLETNIGKLRDLGIEADLILFHPYDRWGFADFSTEDCLIYLDYCIRRLSAYRNIWWSLANEYDLIPQRKGEDWDAFGEKILSEDPYRHLTSIHHCLAIYPKRDWMTHCSIQSGFVKRMAEWQKEYNLPVMNDEYGYEGNIEYDWGNLSAFEFVHRAWTVITGGGFVTHGETYYREDEALWWAKGGELYGQSPERLAFLKALQYEIGDVEPYSNTFFGNPNEKPNENIEGADAQQQDFARLFVRVMRSLPEFELRSFMTGFSPSIVRNENYRLQYLGRQCPCRLDVKLPENGKYKVEVIDIWEMTRTVALTEVSGTLQVKLPGKEGVAILVTRTSGEAL